MTYPGSELLCMRFRTPILVALAWLPFLVLWALFVLIYGDTDLYRAIASGTRSIGAAALLGVGAWWLTGRVAWPEAMKLRFYALHLAIGALYSSLWILATFTAAALVSERSLMGMLRASGDLGWLFVMGLWLYGLVAGVSYTVRTRERLRRQEGIAARATELALEARLTGLRARLEPHFLFNALHTVGSLVGSEPERAREAIDRLGDLLRYSLDENGDEVLLEREWAFTRDYLALEGMRLEDRLDVDARFDDGALACAVPPFSLQTLVENAVRHAVAPVPEGGRVEIEGRIAGEQLRLEVHDTGPGARLGEVEDSEGHGLRILRERLVTRYGDKAGLDVATAPGEGFRVRISIPCSGSGEGSRQMR